MTKPSIFSQHPASVGESYAQHLVSAMTFALTMALGAVVCCVHALLPFLFEKTGSRMVTHLHEVMLTHRTRDSGGVDGALDR